MESEGNSIIHVLGASVASTTPGFYPHIFDGTPQDTTGYNSVRILCSANRAGVIKVMHSIDGNLWDVTESIDYPGADLSIGQPLYAIRALQTKWYKTQFINNDSVSCELRLQTMLQNQTDMSGVIVSQPSPGDLRTLIYGSDDGTPRPVATDSGGRIIIAPPIHSVNAKLWNASFVTSGNVTAGLDISSVRTIDVFGHASKACEIEVEYSGDGTNYYTSNGVILISTSCNYHANICDVGARYIRFCHKGMPCLITLVVNGK